MSRRSLARSTLVAGLLLSASLQAHAADAPPAKPTPGWWDTFTVYGVIDAGLLVNPALSGERAQLRPAVYRQSQFADAQSVSGDGDPADQFNVERL